MYWSRLLDAVKSNRCLLLILAVALGFRLVLAVAVQHQVDQPPARLCLITGDAEGYWELAQKIVAGKDYSIYQPPRYVLRMPGFPLLLALSQALFGASPLAARCLLACVGTAGCVLTYYLGRILVDSNTGLIAAAYTALSPTQALFSVLILSETTFSVTLLISLIAIAQFMRRLAVSARDPSSSLTAVSGSGGDCAFGTTRSIVDPRRGASCHIGGAVLTGILIGIATLVRPTWLYVGFLIAIGVLLVASVGTSKSIWRAVPMAGGLMVGLGLSLTPWICRNYTVSKHFVPTNLWVGPSLYDGLHPGATGDSEMLFFETDDLMSRMSEYEMDREYRRRAWEFAREHPGKTIWLALLKQQRYWSLFPNAAQFQQKWQQWVVFLTVLPLFAFGVCGFWRARRDIGLLILTFGPLLLFAALHLLFVGSLRYRLPAEYPLAVAAAIGIRPLLDRRGPRLAPLN